MRAGYGYIRPCHYHTHFSSLSEVPDGSRIPFGVAFATPFQIVPHGVLLSRSEPSDIIGKPLPDNCECLLQVGFISVLPENQIFQIDFCGIVAIPLQCLVEQGSGSGTVYQAEIAVVIHLSHLRRGFRQTECVRTTDISASLAQRIRLRHGTQPVATQRKEGEPVVAVGILLYKFD